MKYKTKLCLTALAGTVLSLVCFFCDQTVREPLMYLTRPESGTGDKETELLVELEGESYPFSFTLKEIPYEEEELLRELQKASEGLEILFLKDNRDLGHIMYPVSMPSMYPETQISIHWYLDSWAYVNTDGTVKNEPLKDPVFVNVQAILSLEGESLTWEKRIRICPPETPDAGQKIKMLEYELAEFQKERADRILLPGVILGEPVTWYQKEENRWKWLVMLTILALIVLAGGKKKEEETARKKRERGMQLDYPEIVSRLSLYMGAGVSTRKAWERIVENYEKKGPDAKRHAAYEEMRTALYEMQNGITESVAYERFGRRCRMPSYLKLGTLLSQNLRKGTRNLAGLLQEESREAFENRKALAKRMGEECESKLLLPMIMMLLTILIIIMYPAVAGMN